MALKIAARGGHVVIWDIDEDGLSRVAEEISAAGNRVTVQLCDVSDKQMIYSTAKRVKKEADRLDILINNAGVVSGRPFLECSDEQLIRTMEINTMAHFWTVKAFLPEMIKQNSGHIVTIASAGGIIGSA